MTEKAKNSPQGLFFVAFGRRTSDAGDMNCDENVKNVKPV
jgi:hypothetical protein